MGNPSVLFACLSAICFGVALVVARRGLRWLDARAGAAISIPTATVLFVAAAPFSIDFSRASVEAAVIFAIVGLLFPALVTILTFQSNHHLGPVLTSTISSTAPLFALPVAAVALGEQISSNAAVASLGIVAGVSLLVLKRMEIRAPSWHWALLLPVSGAMVRGVAQVAAKAGLALWPNPFAAGLIGYLVSSAGVVAADRMARRYQRGDSAKALGWFIATGVLNGAAVLLMYCALRTAPVSLVAPIVATYPVVTVLFGTLVFREERLTLRIAAGTGLVMASVVYLVAS